MQRKPSSSLKNMILAMVTVSGLSAIILALSYNLTKNPIAEAQDNKKLEAIAEVLHGEYDNNPYQERIKLSGTNLELYPARKEGKVTSIAIKSYSNNAFSGKLELIVGFTLDGTITDYKVINHKETPGLGSKVTEPKFANQLKGFNVAAQELKVRQDGGEIDAVTSATISSRAVLDAIQRAFDSYIKFNLGN